MLAGCFYGSKQKSLRSRVKAFVFSCLFKKYSGAYLP